MKHNMYLLNTLLAIVVSVAMIAIVLVHTFLPAIIIPTASIPNLVLLSLIALLLDHYLTKGAERCYICIPLFSAITFGLLPWICGYAAVNDIWRLALCGAATFTVVTWMFTSAVDRISSGPSAKAAPVISAVCLYFAAQCLTGIFL